MRRKQRLPRAKAVHSNRRSRFWLAPGRIGIDRCSLISKAIRPSAGGAPSEWALPTVGEVGDIRLGRQRAPEFERGRNPTPYLRAGNITAEGLELADVLRMDFTPDERRVYELREGDIVLAEASGSAAHVDRAAIWRGEIPGCCFQNTIIRFRPRAASSAYALLVFRHMVGSGIKTRNIRRPKCAGDDMPTLDAGPDRL